MNTTYQTKQQDNNAMNALVAVDAHPWTIYCMGDKDE